MNDSSEYDDAIEFISKVLKEDYGIEDAEHQLTYETQELDKGNVYSFSLSEEEDLLSQWRGYTPNGGYCLSFDSAQLTQMMQSQGLRIGKCLYDEKEKRDVIHKHIAGIPPEQYKSSYHIGPSREPRGDTPEEKALDAINIEREVELSSQHKRERDKYDYNMEIFERARIYAPLFKHEKFSEEKEWRIIAVKRELPELREGKSFLVPYLKIPIVEDLKKDALHKVKIIVGPGPHMELARRACELLDILSKDITISKIPFRNW
ncbi:DUF2971 domain-containing protein [Rufibacter immobilis]|nr:DUF2971 domain-containing protein [Rufibacter immobilis]